MLAATIHDVPLIATIAVSLAFAFVGGLVAVRLRLPPLVGYLLAGIVVGIYSSIFIASLIVLWWPHRRGKSTANSQPETALAVR